jgi:hypothetical protein
MIGVFLFSIFSFGAVILGTVILSLTFRQWWRLRIDKKKQKLI